MILFWCFCFLQETGQESSWVEQKVTGKGGRKQEENFQKKQREEAQADFQVEIHLALERNRRKIQESVLLSNVHKYFFLPITMFQISGKNFELKCWFSNLSKYFWKSSLILKFSSFHPRFLLHCGETMIFIQIFDKYWFENFKESCKMILFSL